MEETASCSGSFVVERVVEGETTEILVRPWLHLDPSFWLSFLQTVTNSEELKRLDRANLQRAEDRSTEYDYSCDVRVIWGQQV